MSLTLSVVMLKKMMIMIGMTATALVHISNRREWLFKTTL